MQLGKVLVVLLVVLGIANLMLTSSGRTQDKPPPRAAWEYRVLSQTDLNTAGGLAKMGADGWELVAVEPKVPKLSGFNVNITTLRVDKTSGLGSGNGSANGLTFTHDPAERQFYFKRPK